MSRIASPTTVKELARRGTDGLDVVLLWYSREDVLSVAVSDTRTNDSFELVLGDGDNALDVFYHPYAYAALRGVDYDLPEREPALAA